MKNNIIITGAANGLGLELTRMCCKNGDHVFCIDKDEIAIKQNLEKISTMIDCFVGDISNEAFVKETINTITTNYKISALINCGGSPSFKKPTDYTANDVDKCLEGLKGMIYFTTNILKKMNNEGGKIVNIMSSASLRGNANESVYCAVKWGERGYTESLKKAYCGTNIFIYGVYPGGIDTNFYKNSRDYVSIEKQKSFMSPIELAEVIYENVFNKKNLIVEDLVINRIKKNI